METARAAHTEQLIIDCCHAFEQHDPHWAARVQQAAHLLQELEFERLLRALLACPRAASDRAAAHLTINIHETTEPLWCRYCAQPITLEHRTGSTIATCAHLAICPGRGQPLDWIAVYRHQREPAPAPDTFLALAPRTDPTDPVCRYCGDRVGLQWVGKLRVTSCNHTHELCPGKTRLYEEYATTRENYERARARSGGHAHTGIPEVDAVHESWADQFGDDAGKVRREHPRVSDEQL